MNWLEVCDVEATDDEDALVRGLWRLSCLAVLKALDNRAVEPGLRDDGDLTSRGNEEFFQLLLLN